MTFDHDQAFTQVLSKATSSFPEDLFFARDSRTVSGQPRPIHIFLAELSVVLILFIDALYRLKT